MRLLKWSDTLFVAVERLFQGQWPKKLNLSDRIRVENLNMREILAKTVPLAKTRILNAKPNGNDNVHSYIS